MAANSPSRAARTKVSLLRSDCHTSKSAFACWKQANPNRLEVADFAAIRSAQSATSRRFGFACFQHANALFDVWQSDRKSETFVLAALDGEFAAMLAHNAAHN